nr:MAG TPA: hypothetical protein [Bacteriophage sp.]
MKDLKHTLTIIEQIYKNIIKLRVYIILWLNS